MCRNPLLLILAKFINDEFNCEVGKFEFDGWTISDHEKFGVLTFPQIIANSSNVGVKKIAQIIGKEPLYRLSRNYGFGTPTGISFPENLKES
ncbi:MAG: hypothetical protein Ct9H90mP7_3630 [Candidatus Neomarinimicrobiota bacterium]|nr:MAG: hypothetical protein Ct9H90mP7_3630 [Candidatus Neomarinimicrobiota bacterium]